MACVTLLYIRKATVPNSAINDEYANTEMTEKKDMANRITMPAPHTMPDFFTSRQ